MNISVTVMATHQREVQAERLRSALADMPFSYVSVVYDEVADGTHDSEWNNGKNCLLDGLGKGDWHVIIQDDAILTPFFFENLQGALESVPTRSLVSLYTGQSRPLPKRVQTAVDKAYHATWLQYILLMWGVAIAIPTGQILHVLEFVEGRQEPYDTRIGIAYQRNRLPVYYTMPSLVEHDDGLDSLLEHGKAEGKRVAHNLATQRVVWNKEVIDI